MGVAGCLGRAGQGEGRCRGLCCHVYAHPGDSLFIQCVCGHVVQKPPLTRRFLLIFDVGLPERMFLLLTPLHFRFSQFMISVTGATFASESVALGEPGCA